MREKFKKLFHKYHEFILPIAFALVLIPALVYYFKQSLDLKNNILIKDASYSALTRDYTRTQKDFIALKNQDQFKINQDLQAKIKNIHDVYIQAATNYEKITDLRAQKAKTDTLDTLYASALKDLSDLQYTSAEAKLIDLQSQIQKINDALAAANTPQSSAPSSAAESNSLPGNGYSRQQVQTDTGTFVIDIIAADLNSTKVIVDTASDGDCGNNCPTLPLATYAQRSGAYAAINGSYFCPSDYPSCAGKVNSFDTLLMNKNKVYFNSANNVYSVVPAAIFNGNTSRFVQKSQEWGRDTGVDAVIAMQPLLVFGNQIAYGGSDVAKYSQKGTRNFIAGKGNSAYIGTIYNATMNDSAHVLHTLGVENAINLDEGGSTALWYNGSYLAGPGRTIPNAVLFVRK